MRTKGMSLIAAATLMAGPIVANAASVTYDFTGTVTQATGIYASAGSTVSGTYTINLSAANPSQSSGTVGSTTSEWQSQTYGGTSYSLPVPNALVFGSMLVSGGVNYSNMSPGSSGTDSLVGSYASGTVNQNSYEAVDLEYSSSTAFVESTFQLFGGTGANVAFDVNGLPVFANAKFGNGSLSTSDNSQLDYQITSMALAPVPLPASAWLLLSGVLGFRALLRKRHDA